MNIRFTSSLTPEDENTIAPVLIQTIAAILNLLPIAYALRIDTSDAKVYQHVGGNEERTAPPRLPRSPSKRSADGVELPKFPGRIAAV
jgi:hypothetical protein